ncbi:salicylate hydroxylase [Lipingzhangella halophila]|uniref:Salicylate hydroxylase n=1 Tax=Lipingzhangella halophila TaxID=1783352 RepID=A0A7W7REZ2_9ACTN|nr:FAD-dependent monooxygenase [Lipingzhangella halophila]MBB4930715.1 salicylate hydroxylase [Lipingzhangella halophila]
MRIVIVGAGIAGLTLATALARTGARTVLLDQSTEAQPVGAGLQLSPNAARPLRRLGLDKALESVAVRPEGQDILRWDDGTLVHSTPMGAEYERHYGVPLYTLLRSDLHRILRDSAPSGSVRRGRYVTSILESSDGVTLRCSDGQEITGDVAIGADGIHSMIRGMLNTEQHGFANRVLYRGLLPIERVPEFAAEPRVRIWMGTDAHFSCYPVSGGTRLSFNASVPADIDHPESWSSQGRISDLKRAFDGWSPEVHTVISAAEWIGTWILGDREPVRNWHRGRIALMGDAAHPMLPFFAQGANQAVEDAIVLASCLRTATAFTVDQALAQYAALRRERTQRIHSLSRDLTYSLSESGADPDQYEAIITRTEHAKSDWVYGYDVDTATGSRQ